MTTIANAIEKALKIPLEDIRFEHGYWVVRSQTQDGSNPWFVNWYQVIFDRGSFSCDCPAFNWHAVCKHEQAVQINMNKIPVKYASNTDHPVR